MCKTGTMTEEELKKWKPFANALLITMPIMFTGTALFSDKSKWFYPSGFCALIGIILVVLWYSFENTTAIIRNNKKLPSFLWFADIFFGLQFIFLLFMMLDGMFGWPNIG